MVFTIFLHHSDVRAFTFGKRHISRLRVACGGRGRPSSIFVCTSEEEFLSALPNTTHALVWGFRKEWLKRAKKLQCIATPAAGRDWIEPAADSRLRVLFGTFHGPLIAQTVLAQLLAFNRGVLASERLTQSGDPWPRAKLAPRLRDIRGTHAVVLGFGHIGQTIGKVLKPFDIRVTGLRRDTTQARPDWFARGDRVLHVSQLDDVLPKADHLICALPGTPETTRLLDVARLSLLPRRAVVCNIGRGNVIDEDALARLLCAGRLRGALLDVFGVEPLPENSPLRGAPNFYLLPHASAIAPNYLDLWLDELLPQLRGDL